MVWRPSMFILEVSHITRAGDTAYTSARYPGARMVHGACGQDTDVEVEARPGSVQCPECLAWVEGQQLKG